jgi:glycine cleavage system H protein
MGIIEGYNFPDDLYYHQEHSWARIEGEESVRVGMSDFFQRQAGEIVFVDLPEEGDEVSQGEICGNIQSSKWVGKLYSPLSGKIMGINEMLMENVTLINSDPYGEGWIMIIKPSNLKAELSNLLHGDQLIPWIHEQIEKAERLKRK